MSGVGTPVVQQDRVKTADQQEGDGGLRYCQPGLTDVDGVISLSTNCSGGSRGYDFDFEDKCQRNTYGIVTDVIITAK